MTVKNSEQNLHRLFQLCDSITVDLKHDVICGRSSSIASITNVIPSVFYLDVRYRQLRVIIRRIRTILWNDPGLFRPRYLWRGAVNEFSTTVYK